MRGRLVGRWWLKGRMGRRLQCERTIDNEGNKVVTRTFAMFIGLNATMENGWDDQKAVERDKERRCITASFSIGPPAAVDDPCLADQ